MRIYLFLLFFSTIFFTAKAQPERSDYVRVVCTPDTIRAGVPVRINIHMIVDSVPLQVNTLVKLFFPKEFKQFAFDNNPPPFPIFPTLQRGYCRVFGNRNLKAAITSMKLTRDEFILSYPFPEYKHDDNEYLMTIRLDSVFRPGDTLTVTYGFGGNNNLIIPVNYSFRSMFKAMIDFDRNGTYTLQKSTAPIKSSPRRSDALQLFLSSTGKVNNATLLRAVVFDDNISFVPGFTGSFSLSCSNPGASFPTVITFTPADSGHLDIPVSFSQPGIYTFNAQLISGNSAINKINASNPILISSDTMQIYWGEFHTHTEMSRDGEGQDAFQYAKYAMGLDFFGQTDHTDGNNEPGIDNNEWEELTGFVKSFNQPNRFVTFVGWENSMDAPSGHYNFIFNTPDSLMYLIPKMPKDPYNTIAKNWTKLDSMDSRVEVLTIPHHSGKIFSIFPSPVCSSCNSFGGSFANNKYKRLIEIYSGHGLSEAYAPNHPLSYTALNSNARSNNGKNYLQDALALREKLGIISSSDNHLARATQKQYGSFAVIAENLERDNLFYHIKNRHTYGTTGERMILKFYVNDKLMGDELDIPCNGYPKLKFDVIGTDVLEYIEILKWDFRNGTYTSDNHPVFTVLKRYNFNSSIRQYTDSLVDGFLTDSSVYYMRVKQKNKVSDREVWAWSSPVWVNKVNCDSSPKDVMLNLKVSDSTANRQYKIHTSWTVQNQVNANYYILQRSNNNDHFIDYSIIDARGNIGDTINYVYIDSFPNDSVLFYRVQLITYFDSVIYSNVDSVKINYIVDSILSFSARLEENGVRVNWSGREFSAASYDVQRAPIRSSFSVVADQLPLYLPDSSTYTLLDIIPLKDSSVYRVLMNFPNGTFKLSKTDTIYFVMDSIIDFYTQLIGDSILISWKGVHEHQTTAYEVQKSVNNMVFTTLETVLPQGSLYDTVTYVRYDTLLAPGKNYYKIRQTIIGEPYHYTKADSQFVVKSSVKPIPTKNNLSIKIANSFMYEGHVDLNVLTDSRNPVKGNFFIVDMNGKVLYNENATIPSGNGHFIFPTVNFNSGVYYLMFGADNEYIKQAFYILRDY